MVSEMIKMTTMMMMTMIIMVMMMMMMMVIIMVMTTMRQDKVLRKKSDCEKEAKGDKEKNLSHRLSIN